MKKYILICIAAVLFLSCEETIELDLNQVQQLYVIDGLITNQNKQHTITVKQSVDFYQANTTPGVSDATVVVSDNEGNRWQFTHNDTLPGEYYAEVPFAGKVGNTYSLEVTIRGETFTASDELLPVTTIDSMVWVIDEEEQEDPEEEGEYYDILIYTKEPQETEDYYLFKFYQNDTIQNFNGTAVFFADDVLIGENIDGIEGAEYYRKGDVARFEAYSLSRDAYVFYSDLSTVLNSDGGMFGPVPANPRTNLKGGALGLFQVSAIEVAEIVIGE